MFALIAAAVMFATNPKTEMPMMSATMKIASCQRFVGVEAMPMLDIANWAPKDRELASYAIEQGNKIAPDVNLYQCQRMITRAAADIAKLRRR